MIGSLVCTCDEPGCTAQIALEFPALTTSFGAMLDELTGHGWLSGLEDDLEDERRPTHSALSWRVRLRCPTHREGAPLAAMSTRVDREKPTDRPPPAPDAGVDAELARLRAVALARAADAARATSPEAIEALRVRVVEVLREVDYGPRADSAEKLVAMVRMCIVTRARIAELGATKMLTPAAAAVVERDGVHMLRRLAALVEQEPDPPAGPVLALVAVARELADSLAAVVTLVEQTHSLSRSRGSRP